MTTTKSKIRICALILYPYDTAPGQRFRIEQWEHYLSEYGIEIDYYPFADNDLSRIMPQNGKFIAKVSRLCVALLKRISHLFVIRKYDLVFVYRAAAMIGPAWLEQIMRLTGRPIIFDFDDAIFMPDTAAANKLFSWAKFSGKTASICKLSTAVTVGNEWLAEYSRQYNKNTFVVPTSIDTNAYQPIAKEKSDKIVVGWTGSSTSQYHLEMFESMLNKLLQNQSVEIRVISNREPTFKTIPYTWREWSPETEVNELGAFDIGIMPNPDDEWSKGKCALKALQYMSMAIPTICSDVGANREVIQHGKNGFLAKTEADWLDYLGDLIQDSSLRTRIGDEARRTVVEKYSMSQCAELFRNVIMETLDLNNRK